jgi:hypothetical protein
MRLSKMIGAVLVSSMLCAAPVGAQPVNDQLRATARALADEGMTFYEQRKYAEALDRFDRASEIIQAPTITLHAARSLDKLGRLVEAAERYRTCINTPLDDKASEAFRAAQDAARSELQALTPRIPSIEIAVKGPGANEAIVTLDGRRVPKALIGVKTLVNPGDHKILASTETHADVEEVTITEKQLSRVVLELEPKAGSNPDQIIGPDKPVTLPPPMNGKRVGGFVALGVGGALTVVGIATGISALDKEKLLEKQCPTDGRPVEDPDCFDESSAYYARYNTYEVQRGVSVAGFVLGGVGIATGVVLLVLAAKSKPPPQPATNSLHIEPWIGAGTAGFRGTF